MNLDTLPPIVRRRLASIAEAQHVPERVLIIRAIIRDTGLEGVPIPESEIWGRPMPKKNQGSHH